MNSQGFLSAMTSIKTCAFFGGSFFCLVDGYRLANHIILPRLAVSDHPLKHVSDNAMTMP